MENIQEEVFVINSKLVTRRSFKKDSINPNDNDRDNKIKDLDDLYENDLQIGSNVNLLQPLPN